MTFKNWPLSLILVSEHLYVEFSGGTSLQQQLDVPRVVHSEPVAAGQGVEQRCFSFKGEFTNLMNEHKEDFKAIRAPLTYCVCLLRLHRHPDPAGSASRGAVLTPHWPDPKDCSHESGRNIYTWAGQMEREDGSKGQTASSPCPSSQRLLRGWRAASPCSACFSRLRRVAGCSTILDLEDETNVYSEKIFQALLSLCCQTRGDSDHVYEKRSFKLCDWLDQE